MNSHLHLTARLHDYEERKREREDGGSDILCVEDGEGNGVDVGEGPNLVVEEEGGGGETDIEVEADSEENERVRGRGMADELDVARGDVMVAMEGTKESCFGGDESVTVEADTSNGIEELNTSSELNRLLEEKEREEGEARRDA